MKNSSLDNTLLPKEIFSVLPEDVYRNLFFHLGAMINYEPFIGVMGKTGAGKSSLCNTLFSSPPASVDAVKGCTRLAQQYKTSDGLHALNIIDFPGIGETPTLDKIYVHLYQHWLNKLDLIVWVLKADDRAWNDDIRCYRQLVSQGADPARFLFVLNQADKIEPCRARMGYCNPPTFSAASAEPAGESNPSEYRIFSGSSWLGGFCL